ncbi:4'-phosphopantetheinyl transferase family protein [Aquimarina rhabdastrellae]
MLQLNSYEQIQLSISHKNDCAAVVVCEVGHPMAIDIEINGDKLNYEVVAKQCTLRELSLTQSIPENIRYGLLWTAKEAISKVLKTGLMTSFQLFEITKV